MIIVMKQTAEDKDIQNIIQKIKSAGLDVHLSTGESRTIVGIVGDVTKVINIPWMSFTGVSKTVPISFNYKLSSLAFHPQRTVIDLGDDIKIGGGGLAVMAGPCAVESEEQLMEAALMAKEGGANILRGGAYKPRTSPYAFQGLEKEGLILLRKTADKLGMKVVTEIMDTESLPLFKEYVDIVQVGARNMQNFSLLKALGKIDKPVALKRGLSGTIDEWLNAAEYIASGGNTNIILIERGIRTYEVATRNTFDLSAIPLLKKLSHYPVVADPSHGVGIWDLVPAMSRASVAAGADGLIIEIHPRPQEAWSDGPQSLNRKTWLKMMREVQIIKKAMDVINNFQHVYSKTYLDE